MDAEVGGMKCATLNGTRLPRFSGRAHGESRPHVVEGRIVRRCQLRHADLLANVGIEEDVKDALGRVCQPEMHKTRSRISGIGCGLKKLEAVHWRQRFSNLPPSLHVFSRILLRAKSGLQLLDKLVVKKAHVGRLKF